MKIPLLLFPVLLLLPACDKSEEKPAAPRIPAEVERPHRPPPNPTPSTAETPPATNGVPGPPASPPTPPPTAEEIEAFYTLTDGLEKEATAAMAGGEQPPPEVRDPLRKKVATAYRTRARYLAAMPPEQRREAVTRLASFMKATQSIMLPVLPVPHQPGEGKTPPPAQETPPPADPSPSPSPAPPQ